MKTQFHVVVSNPPASQKPSGASPFGIIRRLHLLFGGFLLATIAIGVLLFGLVLSFVIVCILCIALSIAIVGVILRVAFRQPKN